MTTAHKQIESQGAITCIKLFFGKHRILKQARAHSSNSQHLANGNSNNEAAGETQIRFSFTVYDDCIKN